MYFGPIIDPRTHLKVLLVELLAGGPDNRKGVGRQRAKGGAHDDARNPPGSRGLSRAQGQDPGPCKMHTHHDREVRKREESAWLSNTMPPSASHTTARKDEPDGLKECTNAPATLLTKLKTLALMDAFLRPSATLLPPPPFSFLGFGADFGLDDVAAAVVAPPPRSDK
jgi:hypothetical protein